jgi:Fic family protein
MDTPWNWQQPDWPQFSYDPSQLFHREQEFLTCAGELSGVVRHLKRDEQTALVIELIGLEAFKTAEIEGELLDRESLQSSLLKHFGLAASTPKQAPREYGLAELMSHLYQTYSTPLTHEMLGEWHRMLMNGRRDLSTIGAYRSNREPMQVVSGYLHRPKVHFEAPPSDRVQQEMETFVRWFNRTSPEGDEPLSVLARAGLCHHWFLAIHPFEDGNGRIGRALVEKVLAQQLGHPTLTALSAVIEADKKAYYAALAKQNTSNRVDGWLAYFSSVLLEAQRDGLRRIEFSLQKTRFFDDYGHQLNKRQLKAIQRMLKEGLAGFQGGLSVKNYLAITGAARATATRDLQDLVDKGIFRRTGETRSVRYWLNLPEVLGINTLFANPVKVINKGQSCP